MPTIPGTLAAEQDKIIEGLRFPRVSRLAPRYASEENLPPGTVTVDEWAWGTGADGIVRLARFFGACNLLVGPDVEGWEWQATTDGEHTERTLSGRCSGLIYALDAAEQAAIELDVRDDDLERKYLRLNAARDDAARRAEHADYEFREAIRADVAAGTSAIQLAVVARISRARVYQIRDNRR